jgi:hypothetical protein
MDDKTEFQLRYVGTRFDGTRLPVDLLTDLPAFQDLLVAFAKDEWKRLNADYVRVPRGFEKSISFDLVALEPGSAMPKLNWRKENSQVNLPGFSDQLETIVQDSYLHIVKLVDDAANDVFPSSLSPEHIRALNKFGSKLQPGERIEFLGSADASGKVIYFDMSRRKDLITKVRETYELKFEGVGILVGAHVSDLNGTISVKTEEHGEISFPLDKDRIIKEFDGHIGKNVQFDVIIELDHNNRYRNITDVHQVGLYDPITAAQTKLFERLTHLSSLSEGWLDGQGRSITLEACDTAGFFIALSHQTAEAYRLYPSEVGGLLVEFEWEGWDYTVECLPDGNLEMYGISLNDDAEMLPTSFDTVDSDFIREFSSRTRTSNV